ncbi:hypothetical protein BJ684DRAFT_15449 [Piptocephalis cylindrospora]|uniref:Uncharacterized protein n=1 Tax=Piptocephalis cylindrospora TaxID=1907219 RepID=A0A4P9Y5C2_9FUNG|nr:hypothetical protein BJ684DRAFT_15449 [Piptocephalis cylindrospora]|eukprot:RKP14208.1 hypothetical protein BJ684DRAFT_15449 [Piptocephalis cylindrospora]
MLSSPRFPSPSSHSSLPSSLSTSSRSSDRLTPFPLTQADMETLRQDFGTQLPNLIVSNTSRVQRGPRQRRPALTPLDPMPQQAPRLSPAPSMTQTRLRRVSGRVRRSTLSASSVAVQANLSEIALVPQVHVIPPTTPSTAVDHPDPASSAPITNLVMTRQPVMETEEEMDQVVPIPLSPSSSCSSLSEYEDGLGGPIQIPVIRKFLGPNALPSSMALVSVECVVSGPFNPFFPSFSRFFLMIHSTSHPLCTYIVKANEASLETTVDSFVASHWDRQDPDVDPVSTASGHSNPSGTDPFVPGHASCDNPTSRFRRACRLGAKYIHFSELDDKIPER